MSRNPKHVVTKESTNSNSEPELAEQEKNEKILTYIQTLMKERVALSNKYPLADRLLAQEIQTAKQQFKPIRDSKYLDVYREKICRVITKVSVPSKEHPKVRKSTLRELYIYKLVYLTPSKLKKVIRGQKLYVN